MSGDGERLKKLWIYIDVGRQRNCVPSLYMAHTGANYDPNESLNQNITPIPAKSCIIRVNYHSMTRNKARKLVASLIHALWKNKDATAPSNNHTAIDIDRTTYTTHASDSSSKHDIHLLPTWHHHLHFTKYLPFNSSHLFPSVYTTDISSSTSFRISLVICLPLYCPCHPIYILSITKKDT